MMKSLIIDLTNKQSTSKETDSLQLELSNTLTTIRGQCFFTSALIISNEHRTFLLGYEQNYKRLVHCYQELFERSDFPLSESELKVFVDEAISLNPDEKSMHCLIICTAGVPKTVADESGIYASGFGGSLNQIHIVLKNYQYKPNWSYDVGVNLLSMQFQRPIASAKPTNYLGGILGQHALDSLNRMMAIEAYSTQSSIESLRQRWVNSYKSLNTSDRKSFRMLLNDSKFQEFNKVFSIQNLTSDVYACSEQFLSLYNWASISTISKSSVDRFEHQYYNQCLHEILFTSSGQNQYLLEGSTFSIMAIDQTNRLVFIPLTGNCENSQTENDGSVLESTTIHLLQEIAKQNDIPYVIRKIGLKELHDFKAVFPVSSTRIRISDNLSVSLQPLNSINGQTLVHQQTDIYAQLMKATQRYIIQVGKINSVTGNEQLTLI
jgi:hypothetical protein